MVPLLGAGINLCGRPDNEVWERREPRYLPSGGELAAFLAEYFEYPPDDARDLVRVSQYAAVMQGLGPLYDELHEIFDADYEPSALHRFLAGFPAILRSKGYKPRYQLIVTTNYDDALELRLPRASTRSSTSSPTSPMARSEESSCTGRRATRLA